MSINEYNVKAINDVYKNAHIALQSISDVLPSVKDENLVAELKEQYDGYDNVIGKISSYMAKEGLEPKDVNPIKKAMLWTSIKMKTIFNDSTNQIAEMMINGTVMGINELVAMQNEKSNLKPEIAELVDELTALEEKYEQNLKKFL